MKKLILGLVAVGALVALRPGVMRRMVQKIREHCNEMMGGHGEATGREAMQQKMREHCEEMAAQHDERSEPVVAAKLIPERRRPGRSRRDEPVDAAGPADQGDHRGRSFGGERLPLTGRSTLPRWEVRSGRRRDPRAIGVVDFMNGYNKLMDGLQVEPDEKPWYG